MVPSAGWSLLTLSLIDIFICLSACRLTNNEFINETDFRYKLVINPMVISQDWFNKLPADLQKTVLEAGQETTDHAMAMAAQMDETGKKILAENGVTLFDQPTDEVMWVEKLRIVWPMVLPHIKDKALLDKVFNVLNIK